MPLFKKTTQQYITILKQFQKKNSKSNFCNGFRFGLRDVWGGGFQTAVGCVNGCWLVGAPGGAPIGTLQSKYFFKKKENSNGN